MFSHTDWRYACGQWCLDAWRRGARFVAPPPPTEEEKEAFAKEVEAAVAAKWEGQEEA